MRALFVIVFVISGCAADAHREPDQVDAGVDAGKPGSSWLCYCGGARAITCSDGVPICDATDPSKRIAEAEHTSCSCRAMGACTVDADCIEVHAP